MPRSTKALSRLIRGARVGDEIVRVDDNFKHKPTMTVDDASKSVEVTYPYLEAGKDEYVQSLSFNSAMTYWAEFLTAMFAKAPELQQVTYTGLIDDQPAVDDEEDP